jgi:DNA-nicking Smr family endonuclease
MENHETDDAMDSVEIPIDGTLDLHTFSPRELKELITDYIETCREKDILQVRIIHGKGTGSLQRTVHSILGKNSSVASYRLAGEDAGGWGATLVILKAANRP